MASYAGKVLVYGGKGALGSSIVKYFSNQNWWVASIDLVQNDDAHCNIIVKQTESWQEQSFDVQRKVADIIGENKFDAVLCVAGGWAGGNAASEDFIKNSDLSWKQSVWTSAISSSLCTKFLKDGGLLVLTGAQGMIGYGFAKAAVHHLVKSLAAQKSGLPAQSTVAAILPRTLDTPMNRKFMPKADFKSWTPLDAISGLLFKWSSGLERPVNGSLIKLETHDGKTEFIQV